MSIIFKKETSKLLEEFGLKNVYFEINSNQITLSDNLSECYQPSVATVSNLSRSMPAKIVQVEREYLICIVKSFLEKNIDIIKQVNDISDKIDKIKDLNFIEKYVKEYNDVCIYEEDFSYSTELDLSIRNSMSISAIQDLLNDKKYLKRMDNALKNFKILKQLSYEKEILYKSMRVV